MIRQNRIHHLKQPKLFWKVLDRIQKKDTFHNYCFLILRKAHQGNHPIRFFISNTFVGRVRLKFGKKLSKS